MVEFTYIDIGIIVILFIFLIVGYKKGFIETILGLVGGLVSLVVAILLANQVSEMLYPLFGMGQALEGQMEGFLINILNAQEETNIYRIAIGDPENIAQLVNDAIAKLGLPESITASISASIASAIASVFEGSAVVEKSLIEILSPILAQAILTLISVIATFIVIRIIVAIIEAIAKVILRTSKSLRGLNGLLGAVAGTLKGALLIVIIFTIATFVLGGVEPNTSTDIKGEIRTTIDKSTIAKFIYDKNPVPNLIAENINFEKIINGLLAAINGEDNNATETPPDDSQDEASILMDTV